MTYDAVIVGSGFGGAVMACRLTAAGRKVLVLERGRRWTPETYPRDIGDAWIWDADEPETQNGWIDLRFMDEMWVAQGAGVGGGSLIYANVSIDAPKAAFDAGWPADISYERLKPYYERVGDMLGVQPLPKPQWTKRTELMRESAEAIGAGDRFRVVDLAVTFDPDWRLDGPEATTIARSKPWTNRFGVAQGTCIHCGNCDIGCPVAAKNTLDLNYLAAAEAGGAEIRPLSLVSHIASAGDRWRVHYNRLEGGVREPAYVDAKRVFLAAGSLGSTEILLRSRDEHGTLPRLPRALGKGWTSNGDFLTPAFYKNRKISPSVGPTISSAIDFLDGSRGGAQFFVEDGGFPNVIGNYVASALARRRGRLAKRFLSRLRAAFGTDPLDNMMPWFGQAVDGADGTLYLGRRWFAPWRRTLKLDWDPARSEKGVGGLIAMHERLSVATGGVAKVPPSWTVFRNLVTPHPLGGCNMAASPAVGGVDSRGEVFSHEGLYVVDGAIIPRPIGLNPSKTIAALSEMIAEQVLGN